MIGAMLRYVRVVDAINRRIGRITMYGLFAMMAVLLWSSISKTFFVPSLWTLEMAQFGMVAYFMLGGPYAIQMGSNVRMDLFYGGWSTRRKAAVDAITVFFLIYYLYMLFYGGLGSMAYSLGYWGDEPYSFFAGLVTGSEEVGRLERSSTAWRPYIWPAKLIMVSGIFLMLLQAVAEFFKDVARLSGHEIPEVRA
ncbi:Tripartite ATP-independent periplasmic transporters, DctQ component [Roseovarius albus]|uniref:TRAP transporter small permease protein n=1 Tax=Roseovarius albus TaxID=1247867 RepID=A0A1X6Z5K5_9RHOB|nr:TRAP transporter small permease subunit [Roseovarius albus]SLN41430.1 Tripartite ATP-independent periplasmic transporters, DctQ component [Roseovarius albus]